MFRKFIERIIAFREGLHRRTEERLQANNRKAMSGPLEGYILSILPAMLEEALGKRVELKKTDIVISAPHLPCGYVMEAMDFDACAERNVSVTITLAIPEHKTSEGDPTVCAELCFGTCSAIYSYWALVCASLVWKNFPAVGDAGRKSFRFHGEVELASRHLLDLSDGLMARYAAKNPFLDGLTQEEADEIFAEPCF